MAKNRVIYVLFLVVTIILLALDENQLTYTVFYTAIILPLFSFLFMLLSKRKFDISDKLSTGTVKKNERLIYYLTVSNTSVFFYANVKAVFNDISPSIILDKNHVNLSLSPYKSSDVSIEVYGKYRSVNTIGVSELYVYDLLGLFYYKQKHEKTLTLTVLPQVVDVSNILLPATNIIENIQRQKKQEDDYTEVEDYKKYLPTDGIKKINWKISAKRSELISKIYKSNADSLVYIIFDNTAVKHSSVNNEMLKVSREDQMIEALVSIFAFFSEKQFMISFNYIEDNGEPEQIGTSDFSVLYAKASILNFNSNIKLDNLLNNAINYSSKQTSDVTLIFIQTITSESINMIKQIISDGGQVIVLYFGTKNDSNINIQFDILNKLGVLCKHIPDFSSFTEHINA